ncbi:hypothetical protein [Micromonospora luteifusca]|uniref:hypothetical protein n=1 Tax=Micromonospora luteifusca TaxID=709860 RepID=UPI00339F95F0
MQNSDRTTFVGQWWLPGQPDKQTSGTLQIGTGYPELELYSTRAAQSAPAVAATDSTFRYCTGEAWAPA